ncbi:hypothetical protein [Streptomyces kronopolitis]|nr:hypothetical protein [Streptomyces kronopolitis]
MMKKILAIAFVTALFAAEGAGIACAAPAAPEPPPSRGLVTTTFHCPAPRGTFTITADPWVMGQYEQHYGEQGCTYTS